MNENTYSDLDRLIENALTSEPVRQTPAGFHDRLCRRLHVSSIVQKERKRIRFGLYAGAMLFAAMAIFFVFVPVVSYLQGWAVRSVPGGLGYLDYLVVSTMRNWRSLDMIGAATVIGAVALFALAGGFFSILRSGRRSASSHIQK